MEYLCRHCFHYWVDVEGGTVCERCGSGRIIAHAELFSLTIAHVDCDSFYTAVEKRDNPAIADSPVVVGRRDRGVVAAACYVARIYGIRSAMPMFEALRRCPRAVVLAPDMRKYKAASVKVRAAMMGLTARVEPLSIDEAYLDLRDYEKLHGEPACVGLARLAAVVETEQKISLSIGLSYNKFLSKLGSGWDKPRGFHVIGRSQAKEFLAPLPVRKLWGVGPKAEKKLMRHGYMTILHVQEARAEALVRIFGKVGYEFYLFANGEDSRAVTVESRTKSISSETTFSEDLRSLSALLSALPPLCSDVVRRLRGQSLSARVVVLKLKDSDFRNVTRSRKRGVAFNDEAVLGEAAAALLRDFWERGGKERRGYRLLGVGVSDLLEQEETDMFDFGDDAEKEDTDEDVIKDDSTLAKTLKEIKDKFGENAIGFRSESG